MPRARSQYIAEMRERFEVVDRVKASAEEKASLTKAIQEDEVSSPEVSPSKENTLKKEDVIKLSFKDPPEYDDVKKDNDIKVDEDDNVQDQKDEEGEDEIVEDDVYEDVETGLKVWVFNFSDNLFRYYFNSYYTVGFHTGGQ